MANVVENLASWSATAASNQPDSTDANTIVADLQAIQAAVRKYVATRDTIASGTTVDLSSVGGPFVSVTHSTGTTAMSSFGTLSAGMWKIVTFALTGGSLSLTHHATQMIVPGGVSLSLANGDSLFAESLGSGNWKIHFAPGSASPLPRGYISGLTYANGTDTTNDIDIAVGAARDGTNAYNLNLATALTKRLDAAWSVGTGNGGLDTGSIADAQYYIWLIARSDTGVVDALFSTSAIAPTMPANYDYKRLIGWIKRVSSAILAFHTYEAEGGGLEFLHDAPIFDVGLINTLTTSRRTDTLSVPTAFSVTALINAEIADASSFVHAYICCPDVSDQAPSSSASPGGTITNNVLAGATLTSLEVRTSATGTIASRGNVATVDAYRVVTLGFQWSRR